MKTPRETAYNLIEFLSLPPNRLKHTLGHSNFLDCMESKSYSSRKNAAGCKFFQFHLHELDVVYTKYDYGYHTFRPSNLCISLRDVFLQCDRGCEPVKYSHSSNFLKQSQVFFLRIPMDLPNVFIYLNQIDGNII